jgi:CRP-like cAMP-binding protein
LTARSAHANFNAIEIDFQLDMSIVLLGPYSPATTELLACLAELGHAVTVARDPASIPDLTGAIALVPLEPGAPLAEVAELARSRGWSWLGWDRAGNPALALAAYQAGARAVLPAVLNPDTLRQTLDGLSSAHGADNGRRRNGRREYHYRQGNVILPEPDTVVEVQQGIIAIGVVHSDGTQVLLGLCGPGQMLVSHPHDTCSLQLVAHTEAAVALHTWDELAARPDFPARLRQRLQQLEAWAAMQARPHLDQRLLGLLSLLAEQFGQPQPQGMLIDVRITHAQLAAAAGATRTTITRALGDLRGRGLLTTVGAGEAERFCLHEPEGAHHGQPALSH